MNPYMKAHMNHKHDAQMRFRGDGLSRKPGSTPKQREELKAKVAERQANGTLGKLPFLVEKVSYPYKGFSGGWNVEVSTSDGIVLRVHELNFSDKAQAVAYQKQTQERIGKEFQGVQS